MNHKAPKTRIRSVRRAFTLVEAIVVIVIIGILATLIAPRLLSKVWAAKRAAALGNATSLANSMRTVLLDIGGHFPDGTSIDILWQRPSDLPDGASWHGPYIENADALKDPWGRKYILVIPGTKNVDFDVISYGADGRPGGTGEDEDIIKP